MVATWLGLALEALNQLDRWRRLGDGSYEPYGASFVKAHLVAYAGVLVTLVALAVLMSVARPPIRRWTLVAFAGALVHAIGLAADIPHHLADADSEVAHFTGYVGALTEVGALAWITRVVHWRSHAQRSG